MEQVKERIKKTRGRELPRFISYQACEELIKEVIAKFRQPAKICLVEVNEIIFSIMNDVAKRTVGQYQDLERAVKVFSLSIVMYKKVKTCLALVWFSTVRRHGNSVGRLFIYLILPM